MPDPASVETVVRRALSAIDQLETRGLGVEDEWQYVTDLAAAWRSRLAAVAAERGSETVDSAVGEAVETAAEEAELVEDPHRAIDWLSTLAQLALAALGAPP